MWRQHLQRDIAKTIKGTIDEDIERSSNILPFAFDRSQNPTKCFAAGFVTAVTDLTLLQVMRTYTCPLPPTTVGGSGVSQKTLPKLRHHRRNGIKTYRKHQKHVSSSSCWDPTRFINNHQSTCIPAGANWPGPKWSSDLCATSMRQTKPNQTLYQTYTKPAPKAPQK